MSLFIKKLIYLRGRDRVCPFTSPFPINPQWLGLYWVQSWELGMQSRVPTWTEGTLLFEPSCLLSRAMLAESWSPGLEHGGPLMWDAGFNH